MVKGGDEEDYDEDSDAESEDIDDDETTPAGKGPPYQILFHTTFCCLVKASEAGAE